LPDYAQIAQDIIAKYGQPDSEPDGGGNPMEPSAM